MTASRETNLLRPLGVAERFNWLIDKAHCSNFAVVVEIEGDLSPERLDRTLNRCASAQPILRLKTVIDNRGVVWFEEAGNPILVTRIHEIQQERDWMTSTQEALDTPFPTGAFPLVTSDLFRLSNGKSYWRMTFHHPIADAKSAARFMLDVMERYGTEEETPAPPDASLLPALEDLYPPFLRGMRGVPGYFVAFLRFFWDSISVGRPKRIPGYNSERFAPRKTRLIPIEFDESETAALAARAKRERTTVHGAIMAAQIVALDELTQPAKRKPHGIVSAVNLRDRLVQPVPINTVGLFISMLIKLTRRKKEESFWELARRTRDKLALGVERGEAHMLWKVQPPAWALPPNEKGARKMIKLNAFWPPTSLITNIGALACKTSEGSPKPVSLRFAIGTMPNLILVTAVSTLDGRMSLVFSFDEKRMPDGIAERIVERMESLLKEAAVS